MPKKSFWVWALSFSVAGCAFNSRTAQVECPFQNDSKEEKLCISSQVDLAAREMASYLAAAKEKVVSDPSLLQQIDDSQAAWANYHKEQCDNDALWGRLGLKPYSFRGAMQCQHDLTKSRTHDLWLVYLSHNSAAPVLPEPKFSRR